MKVNNMKTIIRNSILAGLAFCMGTACTKETGIEGISEPKSYLEVFASIGEVSTAPARANENEEEENTSSYQDIYGVPMDVLYSYLPTNGGGGFKDGCKIGIYSRYDTNGEYTAGRLVNKPLTFKEESFVSESIEIPSMTNLGPTFAYYPYSAVNTINNEQSTNNKILRSELDIYVKKNNNPYTEGNNNTVIDLLTASNGGSLSDDGTIFYAFKHACSMLLIYRGEGFDAKNGSDYQVKVELEKGRKSEVYSNNGNFSLQTTDDDSKPTNFTANYCDNYGANNDEKVYSVILPPGAKVKYIQMEDNFGTMQYIYPEETLTLSGGWRYPVTVKLDGLYPTIYPHDITEWDDQIITIETRNPGIYDLEGFKNWIKAYNESSQNAEELDDYGQKGENDKWTFHLYADIDCSSISAASSLIPTFSDCLDGHGHTLKNITLTPTDGVTNIGIIGELKDEGSIENLKVEGITVSEGTGDSHYTGTIAGTITKGNITECKITGIDINCPNGFVGALAGKISAGTVTTCLLEGNLQLGIEANIDADSKKLFGEMPENFNLNEDVINTAGVYVFRSNVDNTQTEEGTGTGDGVDAGN